MNITKKILIFYFIVLVCLSISSFGVYILDEEIGLVYAGSTIAITPILTILTIIISTLKSSKK